MIRDVTDLEIYQISLDSLKSIYKLTSTIQPAQNNVKFQLIRAAESIAPLIAEGFGKKKATKEFCRFLLMALGSSDEVVTHLRIIVILNNTAKQAIKGGPEGLIQDYKLLSKKINKLHSSWQKFSQ
jgi:four helix bundle protein